MRQLKVIERNVLLADTAKKVLEGSTKQAPNTKPTKPEDLVRLYENIYQNWLEIRELPGMAENAKYAQEIDTKISVSKAFRFSLSSAVALLRPYANMPVFYCFAGAFTQAGRSKTGSSGLKPSHFTIGLGKLPLRPRLDSSSSLGKLM